MANSEALLLTPIQTGPGRDEFKAVLTWPFPEQPFYKGQVKRLLQTDISHRVMYGKGRVWVYRDPNGNNVGFGTLDISTEYGHLTDGKDHLYIPLLAVNPGFQKMGHGERIVQHLIAEAMLIVQAQSELSNLIFLDVYIANEPAISLYHKCGFVKLNPDTPIADPAESNEPYVIMAKKAAIATQSISQ